MSHQLMTFGAADEFKNPNPTLSYFTSLFTLLTPVNHIRFRPAFKPFKNMWIYSVPVNHESNYICNTRHPRVYLRGAICSVLVSSQEIY